MKKFLLVMMACIMAVTVAFAAGGKSSREKVTQATLAQELVKALGLVRVLPAGATDQQIFAVLMQNGIAPKDGWKTDAFVTKADLARVLVQALGAQDEVENPDDAGAWVQVLEAHGISLSSGDGIGQTVMDMEAIPVVVSHDYTLASVDPLVNEALASGAYDQYTVPIETIVRVLSELEIDNGEVHPKPPTPH